jgi:hypothetical protein
VQVRIIEDTAVAHAGAVRASRDGRTVIVLDPGLPDREKYQLLIEMLEQ